MAKEEKEKNKSVVKEETSNETKSTKKEKKAIRKTKKQKEKENILKEKKVLEDKIDSLVLERKSTSDKDKKKELSKEIKTLKVERKAIGQKDTYLREVKKEMNMVRWPNSKEVVKYSIASLVFVLFFALFFYGIDALFALVKDLIS